MNRQDLSNSSIDGILANPQGMAYLSLPFGSPILLNDHACCLSRADATSGQIHVVNPQNSMKIENQQALFWTEALPIFWSLSILLLLFCMNCS